jgi:hypothetical protein
MDEHEFSSHLFQVEQDRTELKNLRVAVPLYKTANDTRKEEIRVTGEYVLALEHYKDLSEELMARYGLSEKAHAKDLADATWWRNAGWGTAVAVIIGTVVLGVLK